MEMCCHAKGNPDGALIHANPHQVLNLQSGMWDGLVELPIADCKRYYGGIDLQVKSERYFSHEMLLMLQRVELQFIANWD